MVVNRRWLFLIWLSTAALALQTTAPAAEPLPADVQKLAGVWLVRSAMLGPRSQLSNAWTSTVTLRGSAFTVSNFCGSSIDLTGTFAIDPAAKPGAIDLKVRGIDMRGLLEAIKYPERSLPGIYEIDGDSLTLCFQIGLQPERPADFVPRGPRVLVLSLVRAVADFKEFPKHVSVVATDAAGAPVAGASVFSQMMLWRDPQTEKAAEPEWKYTEIAKTGTDGSAQVAYHALDSCVAAVRDTQRKLTGFAAVSPALLQKGVVHVTLQPECHVSGTMVCNALAEFGKPIGWTNCYLICGEHRIGMCSVTPGQFEFYVPPGQYTLRAYGEYVEEGRVQISVPAGQNEFHVPPISLGPTILTLLEGHPAPELEGVLAWRGKPVKLADLKGKYVLIDFWSYSCGPCVHCMPVLIDLHERFKDKGLAIISVHVDDEVDTLAKFDEKIAPLKEKLWEGKDLPFPIALTSARRGGGGQPTGQSTAAQYGILGYPTIVLIDRGGNVAGQFYADDKQEAAADVERLLKLSP